MAAELDNPSDRLEMHAIFKGRVQGVGFRATVQYHADKRGLTGTVKNLSDGTVEVYAQGERDGLESLMNDLQTDAGLSVIEDVTLDMGPARRELAGFRVLF